MGRADLPGARASARAPDGSVQRREHQPGAQLMYIPEHLNPTDRRNQGARPRLRAGAAPGLGGGHALHAALRRAVLAPEPPALASEAYARDYHEVKRLGGRESSARTAEQTEIARFWFEGIPAWSRIARVVAQDCGLNAWDSARLLALMHLAMADGYIAGFKVRYVYDFWRPVTAIR